MKILYFSDKYAHGVMGTKRSIFEEVKRRGHEILWVDKQQVKQILNLIGQHNPNQIWLAHSDLRLPNGYKKKIDLPVVGFGFSDPYYFSEERFNSYDVYITNHYQTLEKYKDQLPTFYNPTACDFNFHTNLHLPKTIDISVIGTAVHPRFQNSRERIHIVNKLRKDLPYKIITYGHQWPKHVNNNNQITGKDFLQVINASKIGLDIQDDWSPLAHRMFEYSSCGTPVITRFRPEILKVFKIGEEILTYNNYNELKNKLDYFLTHEEELESLARNAAARCRKDHDIKNRVNSLLGFLEQI